MMEERLAEPQDDEDPNAIRIPEYRKLFNKLPRLGVSIKVHKQNKPRFMARCHQTTLTQLGEWLTRTLKAMSVESEEVWKDMFMTAGVITTGSWVINSNEQVRRRMDKMDNNPRFSNANTSRHQQTYDFSTMYTTLKLESPPGDGSKDSRGMKEMMKKYAALVFDWAKQNHSPWGKDKVLLVSKNSAGKWIDKDGRYGDTKTKKVITPERFEKWINFLLDNLYIQVGDELLRQVVGIPMGVSCSPHLANLMLFMYELEFFDDFISTYNPIRNKTARQLLWKLSCCTRYIDDLWNPLVPKTKSQSITRQMYPTWLQLGDPESEGTMVDYLALTTSCNTARQGDTSKRCSTAQGDTTKRCSTAQGD